VCGRLERVGVELEDEHPLPGGHGPDESAAGIVHQADAHAAEVRAANRKTLGMKARCRESVYVPALDLILYNKIIAGRQLAFDPAKLRWITVATRPPQPVGGVGAGLMYDPKRKLVWCMCGRRELFVLRLESESLAISEEAGN